MGDRGNIIVKDGASTVFLYTHWRGYKLPEIVRTSLSRGQDRWRDGQYLARILFADMTAGDTGTTGFGISSTIGDGGTDITVNCDEQTVAWHDETIPFSEYAAGKKFANESEED